jgi:D-alanyl-D-alanine dipeptidase
MSASRPFLRAILISAALLSGAAARADDVRDLVDKARKHPAAAAPVSCTDGIAVSQAGTFCESVKDCRKFCSCACTFDPTKWTPDVKNDGSTVCPGAPKTGEGILPPDSPELTALPDYRFITHASGERAAAAALDGLSRLDDRLAASAERARLGYSVRVVSCYRPQLEDTEPECGFVLKSLYMLARVAPERKAYWEEKSNPNNLGLAWPGRTPHSAGYACDLILVDRNGQDSFDSRAGVDGAPTSSIDPRLASRLLDEDVTNPAVGGSRLNFEAWHYEWTTDTRSRCKAPDCAANHWPVAGKP